MPRHSEMCVAVKLTGMLIVAVATSNLPVKDCSTAVVAPASFQTGVEVDAVCKASYHA